MLVGGLGQLLVQLPELRRLGVPLTPSAEWRHPAVARIAHRLWPAVFALAAVQITVVVNTLLASLLPAGTVSYLYYADRVMEFPLGIFGIALATAALPSMSAQAARGELVGLRATLEFALRMAAFVAIPAAVGLVLLGGPIVRAALPARRVQRGRRGRSTAQALTGYAVGLPAFSATRIAAQTFYALGDTRTPVIVGFLSVAVNVVLALLLMWPMRHTGLALASSLSSYVNVLGLCWLLRRRLDGPRGRDLSALARPHPRGLRAARALVRVDERARAGRARPGRRPRPRVDGGRAGRRRGGVRRRRRRAGIDRAARAPRHAAPPRRHLATRGGR